MLKIKVKPTELAKKEVWIFGLFYFLHRTISSSIKRLFGDNIEGSKAKNCEISKNGKLKLDTLS